MLLSFLLRSASESKLVSAVKRVGASRNLLRESVLFQTLFSTLIVLKEEFGQSVVGSLSRRTLSAVGALLKFSSGMIPRRESSLVRTAADLLVSPWALILGLAAFFCLAEVSYSAPTRVAVLVGLAGGLLGLALGGVESRDLRILRKNFIYGLGWALLLTGVAGFILQIEHAGGIPLLNEEVRRRLSPIYNYLAWSVVPGAALILGSSNPDTDEEYGLLFMACLSSLAIVTLLGYRTEMVALLLAVVVSSYLRGLMRPLTSLLLITGISSLYLAATFARLAGSGLPVSPWSVALERVTLTASYFDLLVQRFGYGGVTHGSVHAAVFSSLVRWLPGPRVGPRTIIAGLVGARPGVSVTASILAQFYLDFGIAGVFLGMAALSFLLRLLYSEESPGPYAVLYSYSLVGIETGLLDLNVYFYVAIAIAAAVLSLGVREEAS